MADTCIVCLGDLRTYRDEDQQLDTADAATGDHDPVNHDQVNDDTNHHNNNNNNNNDVEKLRIKSLDDDDEIVAHLLPCKHDLHNSCLKPWVERANSCPICRAVFNMVELTETVGGPVLDSYAVQDKVQEAEIDPAMIVEDELYAIEAWEPCLICGAADDTHETMYCDGCDKAVHVFCAGLNDSPDVWYCRNCLSDLESDVALPGVASALARPSRQRTRVASRRNRRSNDAIWARVWQEVSRQLDFDLDFPFDDDSDHRTEEQRREFRHWERRLQIGSTQGATTRLREIAEARLRPAVVPAPESQDEIRAWNAFDKARESQETEQVSRRRKRKTTSSPASPNEDPEPTEQPQLKRPRLRRPPVSESANAAESSTAAAQRQDLKSTFLSSLLRDVESKPISATSPTASEYPNGAYSPRISSPVGSPISSGYVSPRGASVTPPPQRPMSPPLSSTIIPMQSPLPATFSPFSPADDPRNVRAANGFVSRGRTRRRHADAFEALGRAASSSPTGTLSYSTKEELQRMVKNALGTRYRDKEITKDQYTDINRDVSRKLYDLVGDASALSERVEREKWQGIADAEVKRAVAALASDAAAETTDGTSAEDDA